MSRQKIIELVWIVVIIVLFVVSIQMIRSGELQSIVASFGIWAPLIVILLKIATLVVAPLGGTPLYLIAGGLFGSWEGFLICLLGDVLGSAACFCISRVYGSRIVRLFSGDKFFAQIEKFLLLLENTKSFIKARLVLLKLPEIFAYAAGLSKVNFWKFIFMQTIFFIPIDFAFVFLGSKIADLSGRSAIFGGVLVVLVAVIGSFLLYKDYQKLEGM